MIGHVRIRSLTGGSCDRVIPFANQPYRKGPCPVHPRSRAAAIAWSSAGSATRIPTLRWDTHSPTDTGRGRGAS